MTHHKKWLCVITNLDCEFGHKVITISEYWNHCLEPPWIWTWIHNKQQCWSHHIFFGCVSKPSLVSIVDYWLSINILVANNLWSRLFSFVNKVHKFQHLKQMDFIVLVNVKVSIIIVLPYVHYKHQSFHHEYFPLRPIIFMFCILAPSTFLSDVDYHYKWPYVLL